MCKLFIFWEWDFVFVHLSSGTQGAKLGSQPCCHNLAFASLWWLASTWVVCCSSRCCIAKNPSIRDLEGFGQLCISPTPAMNKQLRTRSQSVDRGLVWWLTRLEEISEQPIAPKQNHGDTAASTSWSTVHALLVARAISANVFRIRARLKLASREVCVDGSLDLTEGLNAELANGLLPCTYAKTMTRTLEASVKPGRPKKNKVRRPTSTLRISTLRWFEANVVEDPSTLK